MLSRGLQRMQAAIGLHPDPLRLLAGRKRVGQPDRPNLWSWAPEFRAKAVVAELASQVRIAAHGSVGARLGVQTSASAGLAYHDALAVEPFADDAWTKQVDKVLRAAIEREERMPEILTQRTDVWSYFHAVLGLAPGSAPFTAELMDVAWQWGELVVMALKHQLAVRRPYQRNDAVLPCIETPGHGSLPSGHATMATLTGELFVALLGLADDVLRTRHLDRLARRIAFNRVVAGVHFPVDSWVGYHLGRTLAAHLQAWAQGGSPAWSTGLLTLRPGDELLEEGDRLLGAKALPALPKLPLWSEMWRLAEGELLHWHGLQAPGARP